MLWDQITWTADIEINFHLNDGTNKLQKRKRTACDTKDTISGVIHGRGSVMAWAAMAASGTGSLVSIDDVTADKKGTQDYILWSHADKCYKNASQCRR